jgi:hypothetical protein
MFSKYINLETKYIIDLGQTWETQYNYAVSNNNPSIKGLTSHYFFKALQIFCVNLLQIFSKWTNNVLFFSRNIRLQSKKNKILFINTFLLDWYMFTTERKFI